MSDTQGWWNRFLQSRSAVLGVLGGLLVIAVVVAAIAIQSTTAESNAAADLEQERLARSDLEERNAELIGQNDEIAGDLDSANARLAALENQYKSLTDAFDALQVEAASTSGEATSAAEDLRSLESDLREARTRVSDLEAAVATMQLQYGGEMSVAQDALKADALAFACRRGAEHAVEGKQLSALTGKSVNDAYLSSAEFIQLAQDDDIATMNDLVVLIGGYTNGYTFEAVEEQAHQCWRSEDARLNAELYRHQPAITAAVLDAACTHGADRADTVYDETAAYLEWELNMQGKLDVNEYLTELNRRFGSVVGFSGVSPEELEAEDGRCAEVRDLIDPKGSSTWNVGTEIQPGVWRAFDESDCYWSRLAVNGDIRDNHFGDGLRITARVSSSDGQLEISGCTFYFVNP